MVSVDRRSLQPSTVQGWLTGPIFFAISGSMCENSQTWDFRTSKGLRKSGLGGFNFQVAQLHKCTQTSSIREHGWKLGHKTPHRHGTLPVTPSIIQSAIFRQVYRKTSLVCVVLFSMLCKPVRIWHSLLERWTELLSKIGDIKRWGNITLNSCLEYHCLTWNFATERWKNACA